MSSAVDDCSCSSADSQTSNYLNFRNIIIRNEVVNNEGDSEQEITKGEASNATDEATSSTLDEESSKKAHPHSWRRMETSDSDSGSQSLGEEDNQSFVEVQNDEPDAEDDQRTLIGCNHKGSIGMSAMQLVKRRKNLYDAKLKRLLNFLKPKKPKYYSKWMTEADLTSKNNYKKRISQARLGNFSKLVD
ncbi:hypothetical protein JTE90_015854 [Oedothorax gibbosus]|uniref:Uncharacterized protein n=1 Tax=Oedothorax gibbosus TaxID=931172 RepID=A0AAV6VT66_9ARAC|nr:hypothetical protein JTE90_015854 [Oedothorax gibbosus]